MYGLLIHSIEPRDELECGSLASSYLAGPIEARACQSVRFALIQINYGGKNDHRRILKDVAHA